jgi:iron(III) transport system substrate-binding protein
MKLFTRTQAIAIAVGCLAVGLTAIATFGGDAAWAEGMVNLYSSRHYDTDTAIYDNFTKSTGIQVNLIEAGEDELIERMKSEGASSPADVFITVDAARLWRAEEAGLLQPVQSEKLNTAIPANLRHPDGLWFGLTQRARAIAYSTEAVSPNDLSTYEALAQPEWKGRVCVRSSSNVYNQSLVASLIANDGSDAALEWAKGLVANFARDPEGGDTDQIEAVAEGLCDVALVNHYYYLRMANSEDEGERELVAEVKLFFPNQDDRGTHINISGAGVAAHAPNRENAIAFLEYLATPPAQEIFASGNYEFPTVKDVPVDPAVADLGDFKSDSVNIAELGKNNGEAVRVMDTAGWR